ncbi:tetratricopeptide repeat protein [uncultured Kordia sp.]|uniref:tetratricopeptide repeat protein n=1 Tax=uncultured Kordia sp. TaxID=507699 RepID=UPI00262DCCB5|nr:tetratricopeptide repeat protein [uncultured Kordia sp.]
MIFIKKHILFSLLVLSFTIHIHSQNKVIDSLKIVLQNHPEKDSTKVDILNDIAFKYIGIDQNQLKEYSQKANILAQEITYTKGHARSLYVIFISHISKGEMEKAETSIHESLNLYKTIKDELGISNCYDAIGKLNQYLGNYDKGITYHHKAIEIAKKGKDREKIADFSNGLGSAYYRKGEYDNALKAYEKSLIIYDSLNVKKIYGILNNISLIYNRQGRYLEALNTYQKCLSNFREKGDKKGIAITLANIGAIYINMEEYEKARPYFLEAIEIDTELANKRRIPKSMISIGKILKNAEEYEKAIDYYNDALLLFEENNDKQGIYSTYSNLGSLYSEQEKYDLALNYLKKALELSISLGRKRAIGESYIDLGFNYYNLKKYTKAFENVKKGKEIADQLALLEAQKDANLLLSKLYKNKGAYKKALESHQQFKIMSDSLFNKENIQKITALEYDYKYKQELDSAKITELELKKTVQITTQDLRKSQQNLLLGIIVFLVVALLMGAIIFFLRLRSEKAKTQNVIVEQKLLRSQMTPHFIFNSLSVLQGMILNKEEKNSVSYLSKFSKLLRTILENSRHKVVSLADELTAINEYMALQNLDVNPPYKYNLTVASEIDTDALKIPPMLIQPFIENAVEHAFPNQKENKQIEVSLTFETKKLTCTIVDNGIGINLEKQKAEKDKNSLATKITGERLKVLSKDFKAQGSLSIQNRATIGEKGTLITLVIPYRIKE